MTIPVAQQPEPPQSPVVFFHYLGTQLPTPEQTQAVLLELERRRQAGQ